MLMKNHVVVCVCVYNIYTHTHTPEVTNPRLGSSMRLSNLNKKLHLVSSFLSLLIACMYVLGYNCLKEPQKVQ